MNILVLSGSPRKGGNTDFMINAFVKGKTEHYNAEAVSVVAPCISCNVCLKS